MFLSGPKKLSDTQTQIDSNTSYSRSFQLENRQNSRLNYLQIVKKVDQSVSCISFGENKMDEKIVQT